MPVRKASAKKSLVNNAPEIANDPSFTQVLNEDSCFNPVIFYENGGILL